MKKPILIVAGIIIIFLLAALIILFFQSNSITIGPCEGAALVKELNASSLSETDAIGEVGNYFKDAGYDINSNNLVTLRNSEGWQIKVPFLIIPQNGKFCEGNPTGLSPNQSGCISDTFYIKENQISNAKLYIKYLIGC